MKQKEIKILIVGAGPTGLTAAIELYRLGYKPRIIDRKKHPSPLSRAVGIAAHSLELLEPSGVAEKLLSKGYKIRHMHLHEKTKEIGALDFSVLPHKYDFMLALPQNQTEEIMVEVLQEYGGNVDYDKELETLEIDDGTAIVKITGEKEACYDMVIGADGLHSRVRMSANIGFSGYDYDEEWSIADFESKDWPRDSGDLFFLNKGHIRFIIQIGENRYRAVADQPNALKDIPVKFNIDRLYREDQFVISIRQAETYQRPPLYLAGDAVHVHSPAGARGMNLGIEDACQLIKCLDEGTLENYTKIRHPIAKKWMAFSEKMSRGARTKNKAGQLLRKAVIYICSVFPILQKPLLKRVAGLSE